MRSVKSSNLLRFKVTSAVFNAPRTATRWPRCYLYVLEKTITSSRYTRQIFHLNTARIISNSLWKVTGAFVSPNWMRLNSNKIWWHVKAVKLPSHFRRWFPNSPSSHQVHWENGNYQMNLCTFHAWQRVRISFGHCVNPTSRLTFCCASSCLPIFRAVGQVQVFYWISLLFLTLVTEIRAQISELADICIEEFVVFMFLCSLEEFLFFCILPAIKPVKIN